MSSTTSLDKGSSFFGELASSFSHFLSQITQVQGMLVLDGSGMIQKVNDALLNISGYSQEQLLGSPFATFLESPEGAQAWFQRRPVEEQPAKKWDVRLRHSDGQFRWVEITLAPQSGPQGELLGWIAVLADIHERKQMEENQRLVLEILTSHFDENFFMGVCQSVAQTFGANIAMITECLHQQRVKTIAFWVSGQPQENTVYNLVGTPCEKVVGREPAFYASQVCGMFSMGIDLGDITVDSFVGVPLFDSQGTALGHFALMHSEPFPNRYQLIETMEMIGSRLASEIERNRKEALLENRNQSLEAEIKAHKKAKATIDYFRNEIGQNLNIGNPIGQSQAFKKVLANIELVAQADIAVLITGETGTGKELTARMIHEQSARASNPMVKVNCAALPQELIEAELFGHEKGAFTNAQSQRKGRFELADSGTLFLDEIGELSLSAQAKILRILQEKEFERVGGSVALKVDFRLIAATNRDLKSMVDQGIFREDLFYRINVFPIHMPPLRERAADIPLLTNHFLNKFSRSLGKSFSGIDPETHAILLQHTWPGNIRELENLIHRAAITSAGPLFTMPPINLPGSSGEVSLEDVERRHISAILRQTGGRIEGKDGAAVLLNMNPSTLRSRMKKLGIFRQ